MPQVTNRKSFNEPYGKGSLYEDLKQASNRTRERVYRLNKGEHEHCRQYSRILEKHSVETIEKSSRDMEKIRRDLSIKAAYQQVLKSYKVKDFQTLQWGFTPRDIQTYSSYKRYTQEYKIFNSGFSMSTLSQEVSDTLEKQKPEKKRAALIEKLLERSKKQSCFLVDRTVRADHKLTSTT